MDDFDAEYENATRPLHGFRLILERLMQVLLESEGIQVHAVTSRVKSKKSVVEKLHRSDRKRELSDLTDLLGIRIIIHFRDEVESVARVVEREFTIDPANSSDKGASLDPSSFGYLSLHYVSQLSESRSNLIEYQSYREIRFEVQVRSILQHAWAEIEHDLGYKSEEALPGPTRRRFSRLAGLLELADDEFLGIRGEIASRSAQRSSLLAELDAEIASLLSRKSSVRLPPWPRNWDEREYLEYVASSGQDFVLMDRILLNIPSSGGRFESCDLLGPGNELIHVQRPRNSASFGHLFNQALVSTEILLGSSDARLSFTHAVAQQRGGRVLADDFVPSDVVLAFPSDADRVVPISKIPPFSRFTLSRAADTLAGMGISLKVIGIHEAR